MACCTVNAIACTAYIPPATGARLAPEIQTTRWPVPLGTPQHDASAAETLSADPRPRWRTTVGRAVRGGPAVGESVVAVATADRQVVLLDRPSGKLLWRVRLEGAIRGGPLLDRDRLYVATEGEPEGRVYALRLKDGHTLWSTRTGSITAPLALDRDTLYAATDGGEVLAVAARDGNVAWRRRLARGSAVRAAPVPTPGGLAVATTTDSVFLLDRGTGEIQSRLGTNGAVLATPALAALGDRLYVGTTAGRLVAVSVPGLAVVWDLPVNDGIFGAPAVARDTVYALTRDGTLWITPAADAASARSVSLGLVAVAGPSPLASGVLAGGVSGEVVLVDVKTGAPRWHVQLDGPIEQPPLVRNGELVVIGGKGDVHLYR